MRTMIAHTILAAWLVAAALFGGFMIPGRASAQGPPHGGGMNDVGRVDIFLGLVAREWQQAWEVNRRVNNAEVRSLLTHARSLLDQARTHRQEGRLVQGRAYAESALGLIQRANQMMRLQGQHGAPQQAEQALRDAQELLGRLQRDGPMGPRGIQVQKLIEQAQKASADGHSEVALRFSLMAQEQARRAWQESMHSQMMAQRARVLEMVVEPLVERASRLAQERDDDRMKRLVARAQEHLYMAKQMDGDTQADPKARLLESAMREAETVLRTLDQAGFARHRCERMIAEAEAALERAREVAEEQSEGEASGLIERGQNLLSQARDKLSSGETDAAQALAEQARRMAQAAIRSALGPLDETRVVEALARTDQLIEQAQNVAGEKARELLASARARQIDARQLLAEGHLRRALAQTRIAARLAQRAYDLDQRE